MGPKSKFLKNDWDVCSLCTVHVPAAEMTSHMGHHHGNSGKQPIPTLTTPSQKQVTPATTPKKWSVDRQSSSGFVREGILHGHGVERRTKAEELARLPALAVNDVVILNPSTMSLCQMSIGSHVLVWSDPKKFAVQIAWPSASSKSSCAQTEVNLSPRTLALLDLQNGKSVVHVQSYEPRQVLPASEMILESRVEKSFFSAKEFSDSFRDAFDGKYVLNGSPLTTHFYGQKCDLIVASINKVELDSAETIKQPTPTLCEDMSVLSITFDNAAASSSASEDVLEGLKRGASSCFCDQTRPPRSSIDDCYYVHSETRIRMLTMRPPVRAEGGVADGCAVTFDDIGGLTKQIDEIRRFIYLSEFDVQTFFSYGLQPPRGIVLYGPPGTGKTLIGRAISHEMRDRCLTINGPEVYSKFLGETESKLRELFAEAGERAPSVIFIDEIDTLCAKRSSSSTHQEQRVVATLTTLMDNLPANFKDRVVVVAATSKLDDLDSAMRRPGRFDKEIEIGIPSVIEREQILSRMLEKTRHTCSPEEIQKVASITHGFVGADLSALLSEAGMCTLRRVDRSPTGDAATAQTHKLTYDDVISATCIIKPSALREILIQVPKVKWEDVGGQDDLKRKLRQAVEWPLKHPESFKRMGITPPKGVLMYGPPGCSKTLIAKAVATESGLNFIAIKGPELFSKWVGESEKAIRELFRKARAAAPSVVFFDEIDALASERGNSSGGSQVGDRVLAQLLSEMDGLVKLQGVFILAATNRPDMIDKALLRPGRLDRIVYVPLPDRQTRRDIFEINFKRTPVAPDVDLDGLADKTDNYSGAEVVAVCQEAALNAMEESLEAVQVYSRHFEHALSVVKPRTSSKMIRFYEEYSTRGQQKTPLSEF